MSSKTTLKKETSKEESKEKKESEPELETDFQEIEKFEDLEIDEKIIRGVFSYGFEKPSPIQKKAVRPVLSGRDVIAQAQSGTGKTATFTLGVLGRINVAENKV